MLRLRFAVGLLALSAVTAIAGLLIAATLLPMAVGWDRVVLTSGSMSPAVDPGDIVLTRPTPRAVTPGAVLVFRNPNKTQGLITHRMIQVLDDGCYRTKGDANAQPDIVPVCPDKVVGQALVLVPTVGLPALWIHQGHGERALAMGAAVALLVFLSRYGLLAKYDPWLDRIDAKSTDLRRHRFAARPGAVCLLILTLVAAGTALAPQPARGAFSASTHNTGGQLVTGAQFYLKNSSQAGALQLSAAAPTQATLADYDNNGDPGLTIPKGNQQAWNLAIDSPLTLQGPVALTLWAATRGFDTSKTSYATVTLAECNANGASCTSFASSGSHPVRGAATWASKVWPLGTVSRTVIAGKTLQVKVVVDNPSGGSGAEDMMVAYATTGYPSRLVIANGF